MGSNETKDELELLARLQSQFGDLDVGGMLHGEGNCINRDDEQQHVESDDESSIDEPTPEELMAWQQAQFEVGKMKLETHGPSDNVHRSALQRRRQNKNASQRTLMRSYQESEEANEWVTVCSNPDLGGASSVFFPTDIEGDGDAMDVHPLLLKLSAGDPEVLGTTWSRLYSSTAGDGLSFPNLCDKIRGYDGPTVLLLGGMPSPSRCLGEVNRNNRVELGFFTTDTWVDSSEYFGSDDCFLFSMDHENNNVEILRPKARSESTSLGTKQYMYCNPSSFVNKTKGKRTKQTNGSVHGLGVGGTASQPRLHITESLEECRALAYDSLFDDGDLLLGRCTQSINYFDIDCIEVWGVGGKDWIAYALKKQASAKSIHDSSLEKARKVDKSQFLEDLRSGLTNAASGNNPGLFGHDSYVEERCDL